jgi:TRAP-type C4-dicarboxylate transport system permease small subunit
MNERQQKILQFFRNLTGIGLFLGFTVFITSFFVSGISGKYVLSIGLSIMVSSMLIFGFGLFINLMEEMTEGSKGIRQYK